MKNINPDDYVEIIGRIETLSSESTAMSNHDGAANVGSLPKGSRGLCGRKTPAELFAGFVWQVYQKEDVCALFSKNAANAPH